MNLYEIKKENEAGNEILIENMLPYKKALNVLYPSSVLMVTTVCNAVQFGLIVPADEFTSAIEEYVNKLDLSEEEKEAERETINFNSIMLAKL